MHGSTFNTSKLRDLFISWGEEPSLKQTRTKLLAMLCVLGALRIASAALPRMSQVSVITLNDGHHALSVPIVGYKNDIHSNGKTILLHQSSVETCCPVHTFKRWKHLTRSLRHSTRQCGLLFSLQRPITNLTTNKCASILRRLAMDADLDPSVFTAQTFRKSGIMAGIQASVNPDAIFHLGGWRSAETFYKHYVVQNVPRTYTNVIFDIDESDTIPNESTL